MASRTCCWCPTVAPVDGVRDLPEGWAAIQVQGSGVTLFCSLGCLAAYAANGFRVSARQGRLV